MKGHVEEVLEAESVVLGRSGVATDGIAEALVGTKLVDGGPEDKVACAGVLSFDTNEAVTVLLVDKVCEEETTIVIVGLIVEVLLIVSVWSRPDGHPLE